jgi:hypothetical protein
MEGTRRGRENARKMFERGASSGQRNARNRLRVKAGKRAVKFVDKMDEREECGSNAGEKRKKIRRRSDKYGVKGTKTQTSKKQGKESKNPDTTGSMKGA